MMISIFIGCLLLLGVALIALDHAIKHAPEGHEDKTGFHLDTGDWPREAPTADSGISPWDQAEGASCAIDFRPLLRPAGNSHYTPHQP